MLNGPYISMFLADSRRVFRKGKGNGVRHHETCPICGKKLVNLYYRDREWKCRTCWEAHDAATEETKN